MLAVMLVFSALYLFGSRWWEKSVGWSIAIERVSFVLLLGLLVAHDYIPVTDGAARGFLVSESVLLLTASVGISVGVVALWRLHRRRRLGPQDRPLRRGKIDL